MRSVIFVGMQVLPSPHLADIVKHFLVLESDVKGVINHRFFPDGNSGIVLHFGDPFIEHADNTPAVRHPRSFLYGQVSKFKTIASSGKVGMLVVVLQPYGAFSLFGIPAHELTDTIVNLRDIWGKGVMNLEEQVVTAIDALSRIRLIEAFLVERLNHLYVTDMMIKEAVRLIGDSQGLLAIGELASALQIRERQLERKFRESVGISPKHFSRVIRLQHFLKTIKTKTPDTTLTDAVYHCGYYDQAHLIREFKKNVGLTPRQYLFSQNLLAVNFIQLHTSSS